jgi:hypothetical protein
MSPSRDCVPDIASKRQMSPRGCAMLRMRNAEDLGRRRVLARASVADDVYCAAK